MARVGLFLQKLLHREYGGKEETKVIDHPELLTIMKVRNPRLAETGLGPLDAKVVLKKQLEAYAKGVDPFDRAFYPGQTVREWWEKVRKDPDGNVLGVGTLLHTGILEGVWVHGSAENATVDYRLLQRRCTRSSLVPCSMRGLCRPSLGSTVRGDLHNK